jgi:single-stranded-DNA-specific exonuclease
MAQHSPTWIEPESVHVPEPLRTAVGGHPIIAEQLVRRGLLDPERALPFLDARYYQPAPASELPDIERAVARLQHAIQAYETILIWGDFDVDGQTSTALLVSALRELGANLRYYIPNRFRDGHGIALGALERELQDAAVLLTCDTGIAAHEAIDYAQARGVDVVVTDHHMLPDALPSAYALVNPMRLHNSHPLRELSGVGTAYKLVEMLFAERSAEHFLDLVALGLVADVMVQKHDTRYLIQRGMDVLRQNQRPGLRAMLQQAEINPLDLTETHLGFDVAPRLNALGRLADANPAVELLTSHDPRRIAELVQQIEGLNGERKVLTNQVYEGVKTILEKTPSLLEYAVLVLAHPKWHTGVLGIVASRLAEQYQRPVVLLSTDEQGTAHGSARSVAGCDITQALKATADLLLGFGGHTMAAGMRLNGRDDHLYRFRRALSDQVRRQLRQNIHTPTLQIDAYVELDELHLDLAQDMARLAPFGNGNPAPVLAARNLTIQKSRTLGRRDEHLDLTIADSSGHKQRVLWWNGAAEIMPTGTFDLAFTLRINTYKGKREALIEWIDARPGQDSLSINTGAAFEIIDQRSAADPLAALAAIRQEYPQALIYTEGTDQHLGLNRYSLLRTSTLILWSVPPGADEWRDILEIAQPNRLILFGQIHAVPSAEYFLTLMAGQAKFALRKDGHFDLKRSSAALNQKVSTVRLGLEWLAADGHFTIHEHDPLLLELHQPGTASPLLRDKLLTRLQHSLNETAAYQTYWLTRDWNTS